MKKLILTLFIALLGMAIYAQERTVNLNNLFSRGQAWNLSKNGVRISYTGGASDVLIPTTRDSIEFTLRVGDLNRHNHPLHFKVTINSKGVGGTDTTFNVNSDYKISVLDTYAEVVPDVLSSVNPVTGLITSVISYGVIADFTTTTTIAQYNSVIAAHDIAVLVDTLTSDSTATHAIFISGGKDMTVAEQTIVNAAQTITTSSVQNPQLHYRYLRFMLVLKGNDSVGTGVEIDTFEIIFDL